MDQIRLPDLETIRRFSIAVRSEHADVDDVIEALRLDLQRLLEATGRLKGGRPKAEPAAADPDDPAPPATEPGPRVTRSPSRVRTSQTSEAARTPAKPAASKTGKSAARGTPRSAQRGSAARGAKGRTTRGR